MIISKNKLVGFPKIKPNVAEDYHGWFGPKNEEMLLQDVRKSKVIVELGSWLGKSTIWICKNSNAIVFAVDHWEGSKEHTSEELLLKISSLQETFFVNCWNFRSRIIPIKMKTIEGIDFLKRENVIPDLIYLDSSHEYIDVLADLEKCYSSLPKEL